MRILKENGLFQLERNLSNISWFLKIQNQRRAKKLKGSRPSPSGSWKGLLNPTGSYRKSAGSLFLDTSFSISPIRVSSKIQNTNVCFPARASFVWNRRRDFKNCTKNYFKTQYDKLLPLEIPEVLIIENNGIAFWVCSLQKVCRDMAGVHYSLGQSYLNKW